MTESSPHETDQRLRMLVGLVAGLGLLAITWAIARIAGGSTTPPSWTSLIAVVLLVAVCNRLVVWVRIRSTRVGFSWTDAAILVGLVVLPAAWAVLATAIAVATVKLTQRMPPVKIAFNTSKDATVALAGGAVLAAFGVSGSHEPGAVPLGVLALSFAAILVVDTLLIVPVVATAARTSVPARLLADLDVQLLTTGIRFAAAATALFALAHQPLVLYGLLVLVAIAYLWHERRVRTREERQAWHQLTVLTGAMNQPELDQVLHAAARGGATLFSADLFEIELRDPPRLVRGCSDTDTVTFDGDPDDALPGPTEVQTVPLSDPRDREVGVLRLRFRSPIRLSEREQAMLASFAQSLQAAIRTATAYDQLGRATAAHAHAAAHDPLTGLANRRELHRWLVERIGDDRQHLALLMIDLKHFKEVNDTFGHLVGDRVLRALAQQLTDRVAGDADLLARFGGDEFTIVLTGVTLPTQATHRATEILSIFDEPVVVDDLQLRVDAHAGLAMPIDAEASAEHAAGSPAALVASPQSQLDAGAVSLLTGHDDTDTWWAGELLRRADVALYQAKRSGRRLAAYRTATDSADRRRQVLAGRLPRAVADREFALQFQPIVELASGKVIAAEAQAHWRHRSHGSLEPRMFLDLIERSQHLAEYTAAMLDDALAARLMWHAAGHGLPVTVNISPRSLLDDSLPYTVVTALRQHRTEPDQLWLELSDTLPVSQLELAHEVLQRLHDIGVGLALDEFGTGAASLTAVSRIPIHQLKMHSSLAETLRHHHLQQSDADDGGLARSVIQFGRALGVSIVADGIETSRQRQLLWQLGCTHGQGSLFGGAATLHHLLTMLRTGVGSPGHLANPIRSDRVVPITRSPRTPDPHDPVS